MKSSLTSRLKLKAKRALSTVRSHRARSGLDIVAAAVSRQAEVVSIDLFDTLVYRRCADPAAVFAIQFQRFGVSAAVEYDEGDWVRRRMDVERQLSLIAGEGEITIEEIYSKIQADLGLRRDEISARMSAEIAVERDVIRPYPAVVAALQECVQRGMIVVVNTDTYLPIGFIRDVLNNILPIPFELICSSDTRRPKRSGLAFDVLKERFPGKKLLHFGDNVVSDVVRASERNVEAVLVDWPRARFMERNASFVNHLSLMRCLELATPYDDVLVNQGSSIQEMAWRWAVVLTDFALQIVHFTREKKFDEIWLLSRDCESLDAALQPLARSIFQGVTLRYIYTSRAASYPILAATDADTFQEWTGRRPTDAEVAAGPVLKAAYSQLAKGSSKRILVVDVGWKGRVQVAIQAALPKMDIWGLYISLDPAAEPSTSAKSSVYVKWSRSNINQAAVEALAGFTGRSCSGYKVNSEGLPEPEFVSDVSDSAPAEYCAYLRQFIQSNLAQNLSKMLSPATNVSREHILRQLLIFPDRTAVRAFKSWNIGAGLAGGEVVSLVRGGQSSVLARVLGREVDGNLWPELAMWPIGRNSAIVHWLQRSMMLRKRVFRR